MRSNPCYSLHFDVHGGVALLVVLVLVLSSGFAFGGAEPMHADSARPSGDGSEDETLLTRDHLLGDWGGLRSALNEKGISTELTFTTFHAGVFQGDAREKDFDWGHRVDAFIGAEVLATPRAVAPAHNEGRLSTRTFVDGRDWRITARQIGPLSPHRSLSAFEYLTCHMKPSAPKLIKIRVKSIVHFTASPTSSLTTAPRNAINWSPYS